MLLQDLSRSPAAILNRTGSSDDASAPTSPNYACGRGGEARTVTTLTGSTALLRDKKFKVSTEYRGGGDQFNLGILNNFAVLFARRNFFFELKIYSSAATKSLPNIPSAVGQRLAKDGSLCKRKSPPPNLAQVCTTVLQYILTIPYGDHTV